ncbi:MAG: FIST C-terminal domain-containing protein [Deltaproteobacteria bacterium]|nr:FIST C-terminal domain-containing protein [Deltaproteobacteria bacterium]
MATRCGVGLSGRESPGEAGRDAATAAVGALDGGSPDFVFAFASTKYDYPKLLGGIREVTSGAPLIGCSTAGEFTHEDVCHRCVAVMAVRSETTRFHLALGRGLRKDQRRAVVEAFRGFRQAHLAARAEGLTHATCFVCTDGLAGGGEDLVELVHAETGMLAQIVGGAAADDARFSRTDVFFGDQHHTDALVVAFAFSRSPIGLGVRHGLNAATGSMIVTRSRGTHLEEIDGRPALTAYERFAASIGETLTVQNREALMMVHQIGMLTPTGEYKIRAPLKANADGSLVMASEVPTGAAITIMRGTKEGLVTAAELAARSAMANLGGCRPAGVLAFDCICRRMFLGDDYGRQVAAIRSVVGPNVPVIGWETYGEIAMTPSQQTGWHNSTTVLAILPA